MSYTKKIIKTKIYRDKLCGLRLQILINIILSAFFLITGNSFASAKLTNVNGLDWPANQIFPTFPSLASVIDDINEDYLTVPEAVAIAALQGYVNSVQPRIVLSKNNGFNDGLNGNDPAFAARNSTVSGPLDPWIDELSVREGFTRNRILPTDVYTTIATKYDDCIKGFVLYDFVHPDYVSSLDNWKRGDVAEWDISGIAPGTYNAVITYIRRDNPSGVVTNINWKVDIDGVNSIDNQTASATWYNNASDWYDYTLGQVTISSGGAASISLYNYGWDGNSGTWSFNFMNLRYLKLVPTGGGSTILLTSGKAALSNNEPNFPKRGVYHVEPTYNRMMTDYANLASSIAYPLGYIPVTRDVMERINNALIAASKQPVTTKVVLTGTENSSQIDAIHADLEVNSKVLDITGLSFAAESYNDGNVSYASCFYLYNNWWKFNSRRLILNTLTDNAGRYRMSAASDIAATTGAARVGLDIDTQNQSSRPNITNSRNLYEQFLYDMAVSRNATHATAGALGWNINEGAFVQANTTYAVGTLPTQYFSSGTFFAGMNHDINIPVIPKRNALDNSKAYIALYMSDGNNLQFMQNQTGIIWMSDITDIQNTQIPINWTIAPSLVDIAPGMLNWFYDNSNANNSFVAGPSGVQYITPVSNAGSSDTGIYLGSNPTKTAGKGPNNGANNMAYAEYFTKLNEEYMRRAALRVATLWHNIPNEVRDLFEQNSRYLYGATLQNTTPVSGTSNDRLRFELFTNGQGYANNRTTLKNGLNTVLNSWDKQNPIFLHAQVDTWNRDYVNDPTNSVSVQYLNIMANELKTAHSNLVEFVRADHWFSFYNEANGLPFDLNMLASTLVTSNDPGNGLAKLTNGSTSINNVWESSSGAGAKIINFDFGNVYEISRYVLRKPGTGNFINNYTVEYSENGTTYLPVTQQKDCSAAGVLSIASDIDIDIVPVEAQYIRLTVNDPGTVNIANAEIYGKTDYTPPVIPVEITDIVKPNISDTTRLIAAKAEYGNGKFYPSLPNSGGFTFNSNSNNGSPPIPALMDWKNGDYATWNINVIKEGEYKVSMYYSKTGAFDKDPLDVKIFKDNELVITNELYASQATGNWNTYALKELGTVALTAGDLSLSMTNDGSIGRPNNGSYNGTYAGNGLNYYRIQYLVLELVSTNVPLAVNDYTPLADVDLNTDESITTLTVLKESNKLPTQVEVINDKTGSGGVISKAWANITDWTGSFNGTAAGTYTLTAVWDAPAGYTKTVSTPAITIKVNVNTVQTPAFIYLSYIPTVDVDNISLGTITYDINTNQFMIPKTETATVFFFTDGTKRMKAVKDSGSGDWTIGEASKYTITFSETGSGVITATINSVAINSGDEIYEGNNIVFTATPTVNYSRVNEWWTINGSKTRVAPAGSSDDYYAAYTYNRNNLSESVDIQVVFERDIAQLATVDPVGFTWTGPPVQSLARVASPGLSGAQNGNNANIQGHNGIIVSSKINGQQDVKALTNTGSTEANWGANNAAATTSGKDHWILFCFPEAKWIDQIILRGRLGQDFTSEANIEFFSTDALLAANNPVKTINSMTILGKELETRETNPLTYKDDNVLNFEPVKAKIVKIKIIGHRLDNATTGNINPGFQRVKIIETDDPSIESYTWSPQLASTDWNDINNWTPNGIPNANSKVIIPGNVNDFPVLTSAVAVDEIHFLPGAQLGSQSKLNYNKAYVGYDLSEQVSRWHMLSIPLGEVFPADFAFGGYPLTWMRTFSSTHPAGATITNGNWVSLRGGNRGELTFGDGFVLQWNNYSSVSDKGLALLDGILELPYFEYLDTASPDYAKYHVVNQAQEYDEISQKSTFYYFEEDQPGEYVVDDQESYDVYRTSDAYQLAGAIVNYEPDFADGNFALVGNPYMAALDFEDLYLSNSTTIKDHYYIWTGNTYDIYSLDGPAGSGGLDGIIAPLQGFLVAKLDDYSGPQPPVLSFDELNMTSATKSAALRSSISRENKLNIVASNPAGEILTFIANREDGQDVFGNRDARKIIHGISDMPEIYTLKPYNNGTIAAAINIINSDDLLIPIGLATSYTGSITLSFTGMDTYNANLSFIDAETNQIIDLTGLASYEYVFNCMPKKVKDNAPVYEDRFFIRISKSVTAQQEIITEKVNVFENNRIIRIVSGASDPIREAAVYNLHGMLIYKANNINMISHTIDRNLPAGAYIVRVVSEKSVENVKLIIK